MSENETKTGLYKAVAYFGSNAKLARAVKTTRSSINNWHKRGVPEHVCWIIDRESGGQVTRAELRPDLFAKKGLK